MPQPLKSSSFQSEIDTMIQAISSPRGLRLSLASPEAVFSLRMRMYSARKAIQREARRLYPDPEDPRHGRTDFDNLTFKAEGPHLLITPSDKIEYEVTEL